jgi:hypothetical protein
VVQACQAISMSSRAAPVTKATNAPPLVIQVSARRVRGRSPKAGHCGGSQGPKLLDLAAAAERELAADFRHQVELGQWIGSGGKDGVPGDALGYRAAAGRAPVRDFGYAAPAIVRPVGRYERQPQLAVLATRSTTRATGCEPARPCSVCCSPRPAAAWPRPCCTSRWNGMTWSTGTGRGGHGRNARRSSSGSATARRESNHRGATWTTSLTGRSRNDGVGPRAMMSVSG